MIDAFSIEEFTECMTFIIDNEAAKDPKTRVRTILICKVSKPSFGSLESFVDKNQAQITSNNPNEHNTAELYDRSKLERSFAENDQNRAQNMAPNYANDANDTLPTSHGLKPIIYRLEDSDTWGCKNCRLKGDIHEMRDHVCH